MSTANLRTSQQTVPPLLSFIATAFRTHHSTYARKNMTLPSDYDAQRLGKAMRASLCREKGEKILDQASHFMALAVIAMDK